MDSIEVLDDELSGVGSDAIRRLTDGQDMSHEGEDNSTCDDVVLGESNEMEGDIKGENNEQGETTTEDSLTEAEQNISSSNCLSVIGSSGSATISQMSSDQAIGLELLLLNSEGQDKVQHGENNITEVPQMLQAVTFADGTTAFIQHNKADMKFAEGQTVTLEDGTTAVVQNTTPRVEPPQEQITQKVVEGQPIQLEDGTMAYLQTTKGPDGLQAITLEDGTTAYIAHPNPDALFAETAGLDGTLSNLEQISQVSTGSELTEEGEVKTETTDTGTIRIVDNDNQERTVPFGDKAFRCMYGNCGRLYTTLHHLKVHERSHTGDRPFKCDFLQCGKAFATGYGLKSHRRVHTGEKPYKCVDDNCDKAFKTSGDLQKHVRTHTGERPFKCPFEGCTRSFTTSNIRKVHIRTHTGERPYTCTAEGCNRSFASATNYKNHVRIHTGEKPYVCTVQGCGKRFTEYSSLYKHHVVHTHSKPYECTHCGKTYRQTSTLAMHKRTAHGEEVTVNEDGQLFASEGEESNAKRPRLQFISTSANTPVQEEGEGMLVINTSEASQTSNLENIQIMPGEQTHTIQVSLPCLQQLQQQQTISGFTINEHGQQVLVVTDPIQLEALQASLQQLSSTVTPPVEGAVSEPVDSAATITSVEGKEVSSVTESDSSNETNVRVKTEQLP